MTALKSSERESEDDGGVLAFVVATCGVVTALVFGAALWLALVVVAS